MTTIVSGNGGYVYEVGIIVYFPVLVFCWLCTDLPPPHHPLISLPSNAKIMCLVYDIEGVLQGLWYYKYTCLHRVQGG